MNPATQLTALESGTTLSAALAFFDSLPPVDEAAMLGSWRGSELPTGHRLDGMLTRCGWRGKRFESAGVVHPLVFAGAGGRLVSVRAGRLSALAMRHPGLFNNALGVTTFRLLLRLGLLGTTRSMATLRRTEVRGVETATMVYDHLNVSDGFRRVDEDTVLGCMIGKGIADPLMFVLRREN